jgi:hypothetical protein
LNIDVENARNELGANKFLRGQLDQKVDPRLARIYGYSYFGRYTALARPSIFLVHGRGEPVYPRAVSVVQTVPDVAANTPGKFTIDPPPGPEPSEDPKIAPNSTPRDDLARFNPAAVSVDVSGQAVDCCEFSSDIRVWEYDRGDFSLRLDVDSGPLERILIDRDEGGEEMPYFRSSRTRLRGPND